MEAQLEIISNCQTRSFNYKEDTNIWPVWHHHPEYDILLIRKNTGHYINGDYIGELKPGTLLIMGPNLPHAFHAVEVDENDPTKPAMSVIQFSEESMGKGLFDKPETMHIGEFLKEAERSFEFSGKTRDEVHELILAMEELNDLQRFTQIIEVLDVMTRASREDRKKLVSPLYSPNLNRENVNKVDQITRHISNNLELPISLAEAADVCMMSPKSFSRFFKRNTGKTFVNYVNELRIAQACRRLIETKNSVSNICYDSGFNTLSNFNRRFQEIKGMTPREFRKRYLDKN
ncbi:AraC family transcriptional regulator [Lentisphaera profundi]|uniref:AraC family transcriptional regulator n=1 Tax=Lentisphaera profundi TaxID=1658616 RepID=A0ABY7VS29_9BACT|nr:AraC family transcriptional regulator [Lentisphaera profundi]WDE95697.1 AraC family transcriptional regulator [Lentisphaera profundi]